MGFWSSLFGFDTYDAAQRVLAEPFEPFVSTAGIPVVDPGYSLAYRGKVAAESFWSSQPNLRKVVDFIARNVASVPLHVHERVSDTDRRRVTSGPLAEVIGSPQPKIGPYRFWHSVLSDGLLYDRWALLKVTSPQDGSLSLLQVPSWRLRFDTDMFRRVTAVWMWVGDQNNERRGDRDGWRPLDLDLLIFDHGYAPRTAGLSPVRTLQDVLEESAEAVKYRRQVWENGARVPAWIERPAGVQWTPEQRDRFGNHFRQTYTGRGENAGGVPILEDGMKLNEHASFKPQDTGDLEGRRLTAIEVAAAFHIAPELVGAQQGNYSNVREYRQMLYRDSLGPYIKAVEDAVNAQLTPDLAEGRRLYVEANVEAKLRGDFIDQAQVMQTATGAPYLTRNEGRARLNLPALPGGDELVVPLNVLVGGQASPTDSGAQNRNSAEPELKSSRPSLKAGFTDAQQQKVAQVLDAFFARQGKSVLSAIGTGGDWWDEKRWNDELADDLARVSHTIAGIIGKSAAEALGYDADAYDPDMTVHFFAAVAADRAAGINDTTRQQLAKAVDAEDGDPAQVFETARNDRGPKAAHSVAAFAAGFATAEAARQISKSHGGRFVKTWVTGSNPRPEHARMDGETVDVDEKFSNGMDHPGQGGPDDAGCNCHITISQEAS